MREFDVRASFPRLAIACVARPGWARIAIGFGALLVGAALWAAPHTRADAPAIHATLRDFLPSGKYVFEPTTKCETRASVYFSARAATYLVRGGPLKTPLLVKTGAATVETFPEASMVDRADEGVDLAADVATKSLGSFKLEGTDIVIQVDGADGRLKPAPAILGWTKHDEVAKHTPEYARDAKGYTPDAEAVQAIRADKRKIRVFLYFGSWCPTCSLVVGRILRVEEELTKDNPNIVFDYYGIPAPPAMYEDPEVKSRGLDRLPQGFIYIDEACSGRVWGTTWSRPETAIRAVLKKK